jgi:superfamily II DNA/RNA helicase
LSSFRELQLLPSLQTTLGELGFDTPTDIQEKSIPLLLQRRSLVAVAETGSGKTLAYVLPMLHRLKQLETEGFPVEMAGWPRGIILVPTRELGEQVGRVCKSLTHGTRLRVRMALGGTARQIARQNVAGKFEILVATPGRLEQLLDGGQVRLDDMRMLVLDEADQLLDGGFLPFASSLARGCPRGVQLVLFAATLRPTLEEALDSLFPQPPERLTTRGSNRTVRTLETINHKTTPKRRLEALGQVLRRDPDPGTLLFANTKQQCQAIADRLEAEGIPHVLYMGEMDRLERRRNLQQFRDGEVAVMLTTDLGGRGLDIDRVQRVINVHLPRDIDNYLHRVGRTARAGREGLVVNLVTESDDPLMERLKKRERTRP